MKKSLFVLTAALMFGGMATAQTAATASAPQVPALTDVPAGHWAKDAIDRLVSKGILLGYPDGTFRGTQNLTRYEAAVIIARLLDQMGTGQVPHSSIDPETLTALQNAVQELAADLAALGVRVSDLEENAVNKDDFARLEARIEEIAGMQGEGTGDGEALATLQAQIDDLTARADEYDTMRADVDDSASSIAALNDLTVLLNQDILDLQDRVSAVEAAQADFVLRSDFDNLSGKVTAIDTRLGTLEKAPKFSVTGQIDGGFGRLSLVQGSRNFDVTRLTAGTFAGGIFDVADSADFGTADTPQNYTGTGVRFGVKASQLTTTNGAVVINNAAINFRTAAPWDIAGGNPIVFVNDANMDGTLGGQKFNVKYHRILADFKFQNYLFNNTDGEGSKRGIVATIEATNLPGKPTLTAVAGNTNDNEMLGVGQTKADYWGLRAESKVGGGKFGVSYAQVQDHRTGYGVDMDLKFGPIGLKGEAVASIPSNDENAVANPPKGTFNNATKNADVAAYIEARADLGMVKFGANYRHIDGEFRGDGDAANAAMSSNYEFPYKADQKGFGAALGTNIGPVAVGAYFDRYTTYTGANPAQGFGVKAGVGLRAFEVVGFFNSFSLNGKNHDGNDASGPDNEWLGSDYNPNTNSAGMGIANVPFSMTSTFGVQLKHDGGAENALVKKLNFTAGYAMYNVSKTNSFYVYGDYSASLGGLTISPLLRYRMVSNGSMNDAAHNFNVLKYGVKVSSTPFTAIPLQPSFYANVAGRNTNAAGTTSELLAQAGLGFNNFLINGVSANVGYSMYQGKNITPTNVADGNYAFSSTDDRIYSNREMPGSSVSVNGIFGQVGWNGLTANYGVFKNTENLKDGTKHSSVAHGFRVAYNFKF